MKLPRQLEAKVLKLAGVKPAKKARGGSVGRSAPDDLAPLLVAIRAAGFPEPVPEHRFDAVRLWRFDWAFPTLLVALEREGGTWAKSSCKRCGLVTTHFRSRHHDRTGLERDAEKYNRAAVLGWLVIRATPGMIKNGTALAALLDALKSRTHGVAA
ncbi:hypothetical protein BH11PLA2_BH11PLA2_32700 [soil metagenome]